MCTRWSQSACKSSRRAFRRRTAHIAEVFAWVCAKGIWFSFCWVRSGKLASLWHWNSLPGRILRQSMTTLFYRFRTVLLELLAKELARFVGIYSRYWDDLFFVKSMLMKSKLILMLTGDASKIQIFLRGNKINKSVLLDWINNYILYRKIYFIWWHNSILALFFVLALGPTLTDVTNGPFL